MPAPLVLLDDARPDEASDARLYRDPLEVIVARRPEEVAPALARIDALAKQGEHLAGYMAYEAGLAIEPRLAPLAAGRTGAAGPLLWFGHFAGYETIPAAEMPAWLAGESGGRGAGIGPLDPQMSPGGYGAAFDTLIGAIRAGDIYQANLTFPLAGRWHGDPLALYAAIRSSANAGYGGVIHDGSHWLLSFSPELFVAVQDHAITARPMKGTRPRHADPLADAAAAAELAQCQKDRAENLMITDLLRNDLSRIAAPGSVRVENPFAIESYPTVHQMTTTVRARLGDSVGMAQLIRAIFPCGSITGAPKIRAMELIDSVERDARGAYCGAIGRIGPGDSGGGAVRSGEAAFNVAIRTLRLDCETGRAVMGVGSAIVADSQMTDEWRECVIKGGFVARSPAAEFDLIETMRFDPETGVPLLELHLERMKASAAELGFEFDRHAVRNQIQALCFEADHAGKLRLMLARSGSTALEIGPLPDPLSTPMQVALLPLPVANGDWRLRHKCSDRGFYDRGRSVVARAGADEVLFLRDDGLLTEGSFTNLFVEREGKLLTPPAALGLLDGVLRRSLIADGRAVEAELTVADLRGRFYLGNALRGLIPAELLNA